MIDGAAAQAASTARTIRHDASLAMVTSVRAYRTGKRSGIPGATLFGLARAQDGALQGVTPDPLGTTTVVPEAGGGGSLLLNVQPPRASATDRTSRARRMSDAS